MNCSECVVFLFFLFLFFINYRAHDMDYRKWISVSKMRTGHVSFVVVTISSFIPRLWVTRQVQIVNQKLHTLPELTLGFSDFAVFLCSVCKPVCLFIPFLLPIVFLSYDLRLMITPLVHVWLNFSWLFEEISK